MPSETWKARIGQNTQKRFKSIFFLNADEAALAPYNLRIRNIRNGDEAMESRPANHVMGESPRNQTTDSSACKLGEENRPEESDRIPAAQHMALLGEELAARSALLIALGNESRQAIFLDLLRNWGGLRTYEIAEHVGLSKQAVSHHLGIMKKAGIVSVKRIGTMRIYHPSENTEPWAALSQLAWKAYCFVEQEASCPKESMDAGRQARKDD